MISEKDALKKEERLKSALKELGSVAVAFSGGVDSSYLMKTAHDVLGEKAAAVTASLHSFPRSDQEEAGRFCEKENIKQIVLPIDELSVEGFRRNPVDRCYHCKKHIFTTILEAAGQAGYEYVAEGSNTDDDHDYRPGHRAIAELKVKSPLRDAGLSKEEIRFLSRKHGLDTWNKPSMACLASRFVYGEEITEEKLRMVEEAEILLKSMGFSQYRVRIHGWMARIELPLNELEILMEEENRIRVCRRFKELGFRYVALDLEGFRSGSMNF